MNWIKQILARRRLYADLSEEIRQHLQEKIDALVAEGLSREEATAAARREFGNVALLEERGREVWQWSVLEDLLSDIRYALRQLRRSPSFALVTVLTLALKEGGRSAAPGHHYTLNVLIVGEVALAVVLLIGAGLLVNSFVRLQQVSPGFDEEHLLTMRIDLRPEDLQDRFSIIAEAIRKEGQEVSF